MIIDSESSEFRPTEEAEIDVINYTDEDLLGQLETSRRQIGYFAAQLEAIEKEIATRDLLAPIPEIELEERPDDWIAIRRNQIKNELSALKKKDELLRDERQRIDDELYNRFSKRGTTGTKTNEFTLSLVSDDAYPEIGDRSGFEQYILETGKLHLLQKRVSLTALREELNILDEEKEAIIKRLEETNWKEEECINTLVSLFMDENFVDGDEFRNAGLVNEYRKKLENLKVLGLLKEYTKNELEETFKLPGINMVTKITINQRKREYE